MFQYLRELFEYTAYVLAPVVDDRIDVTIALAAAAVLVLVFAALVVMPRRVRIAFPLLVVVGSSPRAEAVVAPLRGRRVHHASLPRAPAMAA